VSINFGLRRLGAAFESGNTLPQSKLRTFITEENNLSSNNKSPYNPPLKKGDIRCRMDDEE